MHWGVRPGIRGVCADSLGGYQLVLPQQHVGSSCTAFEGSRGPPMSKGATLHMRPEGPGRGKPLRPEHFSSSLVCSTSRPQGRCTFPGDWRWFFHKHFWLINLTSEVIH